MRSRYRSRNVKEASSVKYTHLRLPTLVPALVVLSTLAAAGCSSDKQVLLAPSDALISMTPAAPLVTVNGNVEVTVEVKQSNGGTIADGTEVFLSASRGQFGSTQNSDEERQGHGALPRGHRHGPRGALCGVGRRQGAVRASDRVGRVVRISLTASQGAVPFGGGQVDLKATVFGEGNRRVVGAPVVFQTSTGLVHALCAGPDERQRRSDRAALHERSRHLRARVHTQESDALNIGVEAPISMNVVATPSPSRVGEPVRVTVTPSDPRRAGEMTLIYGDGQQQPLGQGTGTRATFYTYSVAGGYNLTAVFKSSVGTEVRHTIRHNVSRVHSDAHSELCPSAARLPAVVGRCRRAAGSPIQSQRRRVAAHRRERLESHVSDHGHLDRPRRDLHQSHEVRKVADILPGRRRRRGQSVGVRKRRREMVRSDLRVLAIRSDLQAHRAPRRVGTRRAYEETATRIVGAAKGRARRFHGVHASARQQSHLQRTEQHRDGGLAVLGSRSRACR